MLSYLATLISAELRDRNIASEPRSVSEKKNHLTAFIRTNAKNATPNIEAWYIANEIQRYYPVGSDERVTFELLEPETSPNKLYTYYRVRLNYGKPVSFSESVSSIAPDIKYRNQCD